MLMAIAEFKTAFEKADEVNRLLSKWDKNRGFVRLDDIVLAVKQISHFSEISIMQKSFASLNLPDDAVYSAVPSYGAMLSTKTEGSKDKAYLIINSDYDASMQRFSVAHELGHLITDIPNFTYAKRDDRKFTLSTHVNADITYISEEDCNNNKYLIAEQVANIFALLVLIPKDIRIRDLTSKGISGLAKKYGVTEDAILSRMLLSNVTFQK